jgi:methylphosphotriester-DNA--protein-cysteine methyltransferase
VYHKPTCRGAAGMSEKNRVEFKTAAEAEAAGYRPLDQDDLRRVVAWLSSW